MLLLWIFAGMVIGKLCAMLLRRTANREWSIPTKFLIDLAGPANLFLITVGISFGLMGIQMDEKQKSFVLKILLLFYYLSVFWYAYNLISIVDTIFYRIGKKSGLIPGDARFSVGPPHAARCSWWSSPRCSFFNQFSIKISAHGSQV